MDDGVVRLVAGINPIPDTRYAEQRDTEHELLEDVWRRVEATPVKTGSRRLKRHALVVAAAVALAIPALAVSGTLNSILGFSSTGTLPTAPVSPSSVSLLERMSGEPAGSVHLIATRGDHNFYAARSASGQMCLGTGNANATEVTFNDLRCSPQGSNSSFPSTAVPLIQESPVFGQGDSPDVFMNELAGFAADGVARVGVVGPSGVVASTEVTDNVFWTTVRHEPLTAIRAYDTAGRQIWERPLSH